MRCCKQNYEYLATKADVLMTKSNVTNHLSYALTNDYRYKLEDTETL